MAITWQKSSLGGKKVMLIGKPVYAGEGWHDWEKRWPRNQGKLFMNRNVRKGKTWSW